MAGSTIGFDTSGVKIHPNLLQEYHRHQRGVNQGLRRGLHTQSLSVENQSKQSNRQRLKVQVKNTKKKSS